IREVGIVLEGAGQRDDVDALAALTLRQLAPPDRRVERAREVDPRQLGVGVVGGVAGGEQLARREVGAGAVVEGAGASLSWFCFAANSRTSCDLHRAEVVLAALVRGAR